MEAASSKTKFEWYQTESHVVVAVLLKQVQPTDISLDLTPTSLSLTIKRGESSDYNLELELAHEIVPAGCSHKATAHRVEIKLPKKSAIQWKDLERSKDSVVSSHACGEPNQDGKATSAYPTSNKKKQNVDWDALEKQALKEEEDEKVEGDAGVQKLFQQIFSGADDETKKAMMKSYTESKGTVLSTNWAEVGEKPVECKPPDCMEWKNYET